MHTSNANLNKNDAKKHVSMKLLEVSLWCLHFSIMFSEWEVTSLYFLQVWWALHLYLQLKIPFAKWNEALHE